MGNIHRLESSRLTILLLALALLSVPAAWFAQLTSAESTTFAPIADASVSASRPTTTFGTRADLEADASPHKIAYLKFDVRGLSGAVTKATLRLYVTDASSSGGYIATTTDTSWSESRITYNNRPTTFGPTLSRLDVVRRGQWYEFDVSSAIVDNGIVSLAIQSSSSNGVDYASRESSNVPQLVVVTSTSTSKPTFTPTPTPTSSIPQPDSGLSFPIRAAFYYPWFPEAWKQSGIYPFTRYHPTLGYYDTAVTTTIQQHIAAMQYAKIQAGIASWWGQGHHTDSDFAKVLQATDGTDFKWAVYHEQEGQKDLTADEIRSDLSYIRDRFASDADYLRVDGKFVVFVYNADDATCEIADRWVPVAREFGAYLVLKVFSGYRNCATQPDSWHQYAPANAVDHQKGYSYNISPGFWHVREDQPRLSRDLARWQQNIRDMIASGAPWQLVTSFNEWGEGSIVESSEEWATASGYGSYLDALHNNGQSSGTEPTPTPTATLTPAPPPPGDGSAVVVVAVGDIACDPSSSSWNNNNGTSTACRHKYTAEIAASVQPHHVLALGDTQYEDGVLSKFQQSYDPTWGQLKSITRPVVGNHEYLTSGASGYYDYFGTAAGDRTEGYYAFDLGNNWIAIAANTMCSQVGGCAAGSPQYNFVKSVLEANAGKHFIVYMHHPFWSTGKYHNCCDSNLTDLYKLFYQHGVELSLAGHDHNYQRHAPQTPSGRLDPNGIRHFVVGTGGKNVQDVDANKSANNWEFASETHHGILKLSLYSDHYEWAFINDSGIVIDSGSHTVQ